ncbi:hypothetical protein Ddc_17353 [Ditylenchus destructor]|nr:hypothetical protein Ddc_17353 [Ditylenchus destructor]
MSAFALMSIAIFLMPKPATTCVPGGGLGGDSGRVVTNPTFSWTMYPPVGWTYPEADAATKLSTLIGQPLTQQEASTRANGDITAAALTALTVANMPTQGVEIIPNYSPPMISDCEKVTSGTVPIGGSFGIVEQGAVTKRATATVAVTQAECLSRTFAANSLTYAPFEVQRGSVEIEGISASEFQLEQIATQIQNSLNFNSRVNFITSVTVN